MLTQLIDLLLKPALSVVSKGKLSILIYHRVLPEFDPMYKGGTTADVFNAHMAMASKDFNVLSLPLALELMKKESLPRRSLCITFDDGYADNATVALPILERHKLTATFFISTGFLDGGRMWNDSIIEAVRYLEPGLVNLKALGLGTFNLKTWNDRIHCVEQVINTLKYLPQDERQKLVDLLVEMSPEPLPDDLMMSRAQVKLLHEAGMTIGGHTITHPILANLTPEEVKAEVGGGIAELEKIIGTNVDVFAYPNGKSGKDYLESQVPLIKELGIKGAVSTDWGVSDYKTDPYQLKRFTPWDRDLRYFAMRLVKNYL